MAKKNFHQTNLDLLISDSLARWLARRIAAVRKVSGSNPVSHIEKCHHITDQGATGRGPVLAKFTSSTEMRHPPPPSLR